jgi:hypothetical protein
MPDTFYEKRAAQQIVHSSRFVFQLLVILSVQLKLHTLSLKPFAQYAVSIFFF